MEWWIFSKSGGKHKKNALYSVEIEEAEDIPGYGKPRRLEYMDGDSVYTDFPGIKTLHENFLNGLKIGAKRPLLGKRVSRKDGSFDSTYVWMTYSQTYKFMIKVGAGLASIGLEPQSYITSISHNSLEWFILYHAAAFNSIATIMIRFDENTDIVEKAILYNNPIFALSYQAACELAKNVERLGRIDKIIILSDEPTFKVDSATEPLVKRGIKILTLKELRDIGAKNPIKMRAPSPDYVAVVLFSSGSSGQARAVELTHKNLMCSLLGSVYGFKRGLTSPRLGKSDITYSYLPMSHVIEISTHQLMINCGGAIGFISKDMSTFLEDVTCLRPTIFASVPRLYNTLYRELMYVIRSNKGFQKRFIDYTYKHAVMIPQNEKGIIQNIRERVVFKNIRAVLGGKIRLFISGSSNIEKEVIIFFSACFGVPLVQTYGLTETCGMISYCVSTPSENLDGVGSPSCSVLVRLAEVPSLGYCLASGGSARGEVCVKGSIICAGYYDFDGVKKKLNLDKYGWFHTGDIGFWSDNGSLTIVDRKVNIIPLRGGMLFVSERIEGVFRLSHLVSLYASYARPDSGFATGVVFLSDKSFELVRKLDKKNINTLHDAVKDEDFRNLLRESLVKFVSLSGIDTQTLCRYMYFEADKSIEKEVLTQSYKIKRHVVMQRYKHILDSYYDRDEEERMHALKDRMGGERLLITGGDGAVNTVVAPAA